MLEHQQSHTDNYRFRCTTCNKGFTRQSYYRDHKCPAAGNGMRIEAGTGEMEGDEGMGVLMSEEKDGEEGGGRRRLLRKAKKPGYGRDDREEAERSNCSHAQVDTHEEDGEERTDEESQDAMAVNPIGGQAEREGAEGGGIAMDKIQNNNPNCLQQPCL